MAECLNQKNIYVELIKEIRRIYKYKTPDEENMIRKKTEDLGFDGFLGRVDFICLAVLEDVYGVCYGELIKFEKTWE